MRRAFVFLFLAALVVAAPATAQEKRVDVNIGGGPTLALSDIKNHLGNGYNFNLGVTIWAAPTVGIQAEYSYNGLGQKQISIQQPVPPIAGCPPGGCSNITSGPFFADANVQYFDVNLILRPHVEGVAHPYIVAGGGYYHRPVTITTPAVGYVPGYCDPWWYYCVPGGWVPVDAVVGSRSANDFGIDFGAGVNIRLGHGVAAYVEGRYHYIWGPTINDPTTNTSTKANGQFLPITFGLRF